MYCSGFYPYSTLRVHLYGTGFALKEGRTAGRHFKSKYYIVVGTLSSSFRAE